MRRCTRLAGLLVLVMAVGAVPAADWPQWRGPNRDGHSGDVGVKAGLTAEGGPKLAWTSTDAGLGFGTPAVVGDTVYVLGNRKGTEHVIALDLKAKGKELWAVPIGPVFDFQGNNWVDGPDSCPSVEGDRLYAVGSTGVLICVDTKAGKEVWKKELQKTMGATVTDKLGGPNGWGFAWSPLIDGDKLIITPGGKQGLVAALDKKTGETLWHGKEPAEDCTYASVVVAEIEGVRQYIAMTQKGTASVDTSGKLLWYHKRSNPFGDVVCTTPLVKGNKVLNTASRSRSELIEVTKAGDEWKTAKKYLTPDMSNFHGGLILVGDHYYGANESRDWKCLDFATGKKAWASSAFGTGPLCYADGLLVLQSEETNEVAVIEASPAAFKKLGGWKLPQVSKQRRSDAKLWTPPVVAAGKLFLRDQELLFCYDLK